jgi:2-methylisocitrate lyase-like PEP mutase family enzyme
MSTFAELHTGPEPLLLPNAWDVGSALLFADAGYPAVGTTSMGVAASAGRPDGSRSSREATTLVASALESVPVLVSVDLEDGHSDDPAEVAAFVNTLPVAGLNIEDSSKDRLVDPRVIADKVSAIKQVRPEVFVNVRVDTYWLGQDATEETTIERAGTYAAAGADGIFVPGVTNLHLIGRLAAAIDLPLNVLAIPEVTLETLGELGVRRVSTGSLPYRVAMRAALDTADAVRHGRAVGGAVPYQALQDQLAAHADLPSSHP